MFYWLPSFRTMLPWLVAAIIIWLIIQHPVKAGADVAGIFRWLGWAAGRIAKFAESI